jgi:DNA-binding CsgD family transcriptional regulator
MIAASMIEREDQPLLIIERSGIIEAVNTAAERLFERARKELVGRGAAELVGQLPLAEALDGRMKRVSCRTRLANSRQLLLTLELQSVGTCLIGVVSWSRTVPPPSPLPVRQVHYTISTRQGEFGRLLLLSRDDDERSSNQVFGKQCHQVLHDSDAPCRGCPVLAPSEAGDTRIGVVRSSDPEGTLVLVTGQRTAEEAFTLTARYLERSVVGSLLRARLDGLADRARLSVRERQVLNLIVYGRSAGEIGDVLGISARTAKFHQTNILEKLGADSRLDLLRLLL